MTPPRLSNRPAPLLVFRIGEALYGLPIAAVRKVFAMALLTPVAEATPDVRGVLDVHGRIVPIIDTAVRLGAVPRPISSEDLVVLLDLGTSSVGLKVDEVIGLERGEVAPPSPESMPPAYVAGHLRAARGIVTVLEPEHLFRTVAPPPSAARAPSPHDAK